MGMLQEFRDFAVRGNVVDMAVGVIMGAAFGKITTSLVNDVMMPPLGMVLGGVDFSDKAMVLRAAAGTDPGIAVKYGVFINSVIDFAIVALAVFALVKGINTLRAQQAAAPAPPAAPTPTEVLLTEIRDTLRARG
ncbi:MAG TPA: large-conductance mechanosensitive channel protein MscL [Myxococcota bacterium]|nr:large-conductance mechanosensitive channel protein MscL [Myxococcota bacterium]